MIREKVNEELLEKIKADVENTIDQDNLERVSKAYKSLVEKKRYFLNSLNDVEKREKEFSKLFLEGKFEEIIQLIRDLGYMHGR